MRKVYLVAIDNGEAYGDRDWDVEAAFTTFRGASEYLIERDFEPLYYRTWEDEGHRYVKDSDGWSTYEYHAWIIEMEVSE